MTGMPGEEVICQPLLAGRDVEASSGWYCELLGLESGHGGAEYERLIDGGEIVLQLHALEQEHHHGPIGVPGLPLGNGVAIWFEVSDFDRAVVQTRVLAAETVHDVHRNPNSGNREVWLRDPDGYLVVLASRG